MRTLGTSVVWILIFGLAAGRARRPGGRRGRLVSAPHCPGRPERNGNHRKPAHDQDKVTVGAGQHSAMWPGQQYHGKERDHAHEHERSKVGDDDKQDSHRSHDDRVGDWRSLVR